MKGSMCVRTAQGHGGYTLAEVMISVTIIGIVAAFAVPQYMRYVERGYWRAARDVLRVIKVAENVYGALNGNQIVVPIDYQVGVNPEWARIEMDDPNIDGDIPVAFDVQSDGGTGYVATANFKASTSSGSKCMWIDEQGDITEAVPPVATTTVSACASCNCTDGWVYPQ